MKPFNFQALTFSFSFFLFFALLILYSTQDIVIGTEKIAITGVISLAMGLLYALAMSNLARKQNKKKNS